MDECFTNHPKCGAPEPVDLPTRLVQISLVGEPESAQLCYTQGQKGNYCTLSYCWGGPQPFATTMDVYDTYMKKLPYSNLPKTILDAFQVTRSLGLQYIWIDSLCITQNAYADVHGEMAKMLQIYRNSLFTISAASTSKCAQGFLETCYDDPSIRTFYHPLRVDEKTMGSILISDTSVSWAAVSSHRQPINERGWTLQEALITPRLLIFTKLHMVWKCQTDYRPDFNQNSRDSRERDRDGDGLLNSPWRDLESLYGYMFTSLKEFQDTPTPEAPENGNSFNDGLHSTWHSILHEYTKRNITVETDMLPAISSIAELFASHFKCNYFAGLWGRFLVHDLMWKSYPGSQPQVSKSGSPSWSWASMNGEVTFSGGNVRAEILKCATTLVSNEAPFGAVTGGELAIRGHLKEVQLDPGRRKILDDEGSEIPDAWFRSDGDYGDWETSPGYGACVKVWCLTLGDGQGPVKYEEKNRRGDYYVNEASRRCHAMVLIKSAHRSSCYRRIGFVNADTDGPPYWWEECEKVTVTVV
jgi:Heterokaryon incompatibility protein (HET)